MSIKSIFRKFEILTRIDYVAARFLPHHTRTFFIPPYPYYGSTIRKFKCYGVVWEIDPSQHTQMAILKGDCVTSVVCAAQYLEQHPSDIILDIGGNTGGFSLHLASLSNLSAKSIHVFEPQPEVFSRLQRQICLNPRLKSKIVANNIGLADTSGQLSLFIPSRSDGLASFARFYTEENRNVEKVCVTTVDDYVSSIGTDRRVGFVKVDVEGFEANVFRGASVTLSQDKPLVFCEMSNEKCEAGDILKSYGYRVIERFPRDILWST